MVCVLKSDCFKGSLFLKKMEIWEMSCYFDNSSVMLDY